MKLIFAGTPEFAHAALESLIAKGHEVALVLTQPDRPAGRGMKLHASAVKACAVQHNIPVCQVTSLRLDGKYPDEAVKAQAAIQHAVASGAQVMVVAAYGLILPQWVLDAPPLGCLNIHASLLPRWRGAAPIHRAIEAGDTNTGITIMQMDAGLDTGDMLLKADMPILTTDTTASLHDKLAILGGDLIVKALSELPLLKPEKQAEEGVTYAHKIEKAEAQMDWSQNAETIVRRVRAFNPFPGAVMNLNNEAIKVWRAEVGDQSLLQVGVDYKKGQILAVSNKYIACTAIENIANNETLSVVNLLELQRAGGKRMPVADFLRGFDVKVGDVCHN
ncbi:MAG TPA: methionyl-tRNA formyltransferase [Burkholderiaceae bacterium]|nr:methionyl-tRNA formyltransferase [Burkholderiaceae bacterium]